MSPLTRWPLRTALVPVALCCLLASGCGSGSGGASQANVAGVSEGDFAITAPHQVAAGDVTFRVHNRGPDEHELIILRAPARGQLPLRSDGVTVDEEALQREEPGSLEPGKPGSTRELHVHLMPGRYLLICNMTGHYMGGMHSMLVVTQ